MAGENGEADGLVDLNVDSREAANTGDRSLDHDPAEPPFDFEANSDIENLFEMIAFDREIGSPRDAAWHVMKLEAMLDGSEDAATRERLSEAKEWVAWGLEYERVNGKDSLLDETHPVHLWVVAEIKKLKELARQRRRPLFARRERLPDPQGNEQVVAISGPSDD